MGASNRSRYLAPAALAAAIAATVVVVSTGVHHHSHRSAARRQAHTLSLPRRARRRGTRWYIVKPGDTLSQISAKTGVALSTLESLNPGANPSALQTGQRLRLRR